MKWLVEKSRYLSYVAIAGMLLGVLAALYIGAEKTVRAIRIAASNYETNNPTLYILFEALDSYLVAVALLVISVSLYELFIGGLEVPDWMLVKNLDELKAKFGSVLIPIMAVKFVQKLLESVSSLETLYYGVAVALVAFALTAFNYIADKEKEAELQRNADEDETRAKDLGKK
jgi:uncharacterized membrane protein YqhA